MKQLLAVALLVVGLAGCGGDDDDAPGADAAVDAATVVADPCIAPGSPGNIKKVGEYCTRGGGQCAQNGAGNATICAHDFDPDPQSGATFCTKPCVDELSCGPDAVCIGDTPTSTTTGCVPTACAPSWALVDAGR